MSRENNIDSLIDHLDDAMASARPLKEPHVIFFLSMALIAIVDIPLDLSAL